MLLAGDELQTVMSPEAEARLMVALSLLVGAWLVVVTLGPPALDYWRARRRGGQILGPGRGEHLDGHRSVARPRAVSHSASSADSPRSRWMSSRIPRNNTSG